ncbi:MAG: glucokinase [Thermodesulfobacteriota bacterium]
MTPQYPEEIFVLGADIGGTKTNIGCFEPGPRRPRLKIMETYSSREADNLESILEDFTGRHGILPVSVCLGVAGPVIRGRSKTTNLPWIVSENSLRKRFGWERVRLVNDLSATAMSVPLLPGYRLLSLNKARSDKNGAIGIVAPGTGLGQALLVFQEGSPRPIPSEGGHVDFAPTSEAEIDLWRFLHERFGHVSVERLLSGEGLVNIYYWLKQSVDTPEPLWLKEKMRSMDSARVITETALAGEHPVCSQVLRHFVSILGSVCGNLALTALTTRGIYLGGGITPKILPVLQEDLFLQSFSDKGRYKDLMRRIPVRVILDSRAPLLGAGFMAQQMLKE